MLFVAKTNQTWKPKNNFIECEIHSICPTECDNKYSTDVSNKVEPTLKFIYVIQRNNSISHYNYLHLHVSLHRVLRFTVFFCSRLSFRFFYLIFIAKSIQVKIVRMGELSCSEWVMKNVCTLYDPNGRSLEVSGVEWTYVLPVLNRAGLLNAGN